MKSATRAVLTVVLLSLASCSNAASKVDGAKAGTTVKLSGDQGVLTLKDRTWKPAITVDASNATFTGIVLNGVTGLHFKGGTVIGPGGRSYGIHVVQSQDVRVDGMVITGAHRGMVIDRSQDIAVVNTQLTGLLSDGIDMAASQRVLIDHNSCSKFTPKLATFDAAGVKTDGDHPDCIQAWSNPRYPPTADVTVTNNRANGVMQGVFFRDVAGKTGGFDRVTIRDNDLTTGLGNAIFVNGVRGATVRGNRVRALPGAVQLRNGAPVKANISFTDSTGTMCGNDVPDVRNHPGTAPCR